MMNQYKTQIPRKVVPFNAKEVKPMSLDQFLKAVGPQKFQEALEGNQAATLILNTPVGQKEIGTQYSCILARSINYPGKSFKDLALLTEKTKDPERSIILARPGLYLAGLCELQKFGALDIKDSEGLNVRWVDDYVRRIEAKHGGNFINWSLDNVTISPNQKGLSELEVIACRPKYPSTQETVLKAYYPVPILPYAARNRKPRDDYLHYASTNRKP